MNRSLVPNFRNICKHKLLAQYPLAGGELTTFRRKLQPSCEKKENSEKIGFTFSTNSK